MAIVIPTERRIICADDESYSLPVNILDERMLTMRDEELIEAMAMYKPRTRLKEGDFVILTDIPSYMHSREVLPRCWKVRFVVTYWAYDLMRMSAAYGGAISITEARFMLERAAGHNAYDFRRPMVFGHGYPHGEYPDTAEWLPERLLRRTVFREETMPWVEIVHEAGARYLGYDAEQIATRFVLDLAPDEYKNGSNLGRPFKQEEPLVNTLHFAGLGEMLEVPYVVGERHRIREIDRDHDMFTNDQEDEE
jgi:hypothetical protein